ncbi:MAG: histidine phosphatase family protein [Lachnospiraceae bacterium]|nr:histidine phosphatase family protein [Lachnospiraceae bacterium]
MEIYIVRHGETPWNKEKRLQGGVDIELNDFGRELAIKTGEGLRNTPIDLIYSSPLKRAYETAELIRGDRDIEIIKDDRIKEISFGHYEGSNFSELIRDENLTFKHFFKKPEDYVPADDAETFEHLIERAGNFMKDKIEPLAETCERVMIVAHGAINKAIMSYIKKHPVSEFWSGGLQTNCNIIVVDYTDGLYTVINETMLMYTL